jgi:uncharacterized coiled-coil protein SlyX
LQDALGLDGSNNNTLGGRVSALETTVEAEQGKLEALTNRVDDLDKEDGRVALVEKAVDDLNKSLTSQINAANAMRFVGAVDKAGYQALLSKTDASIGDTYVISESFTIDNVDYHAGDLVVASGTESENNIITEGLSFTLVQTGYGSAHDMILDATTVAGATNPTALIQLKDKIGHSFGAISIENTSANIQMTTTENKITLGLAWGTF